MVLEKSGLDTIFHVGALSGEKRGSKLGRKGGRESKSRLGEGAHRVYFGHVRPIGRPFRRPRIFDPGVRTELFSSGQNFLPRAASPEGSLKAGSMSECREWKAVMEDEKPDSMWMDESGDEWR